VVGDTIDRVMNLSDNDCSSKGDLLHMVIIHLGHSISLVIPFCKANFLQQAEACRAQVEERQGLEE